MFPHANVRCCLAFVTSAAAIAIAAGAYLYTVRKRKKMLTDSAKVPDEWLAVGNVASLHVYPLKSGRRIDLSKGECTEFGIQVSESDGKPYRLRDRSFVIYKDDDKEFRTARTYPKMMLIEVDVKDESHITLKASGMETELEMELPKSESSVRTHITIWNKEDLSVLDCGEDAAKWVSQFILEKPEGLRMAFHDGKSRRNVQVCGDKFLKTYPKLSNEDTGMFSDLSSFLLINQGSVDDLNGRLSKQVTANNFRPNILVTGPEAFAEDSWDWIKIGDVLFRNCKPCTRCTMTTVDPESAVRAKNREPLKTLESYRLPSQEHIAVNGKTPVMGINLGLKKTGEINVGDLVYVGIN